MRRKITGTWKNDREWTGMHGSGVTRMVHDNNLFFRGKNYIPQNDKLWWQIVEIFHDHETAGHPSELETFNAIQQYYWWPGLRTFVKNYVKGCGICQQFKIDWNPSKPVFIPVEGAKTTRPFANCSMYLITDLPMSEGFDSILVVVDQGLIKGVILLPCNKTITAEGTAKLLLENLYKRFGFLSRTEDLWVNSHQKCSLNYWNYSE